MNPITRASTDAEIILTWLGGKSKTTAVSYSSIVRQFKDFIDKPLESVTLEDLQLWVKRLELTFEPSTVANKVLTIKSLFSFCYKAGYLSHNIGVWLHTPKTKDKLAERILEIDEVKKLIGAASTERDRILLSLMYGLGLRVSEVCGLTWNDLKPHGDGGKATVFGKGAKTRVVLIPKKLFDSVMALPHQGKSIFVSRTGKPLERSRIHQIIKDCARRSGLSEKVSSHFLRHSHASHAISKGCNLRLLQQSLGHSKLETTEKYLHVSPDEGSSQFIDI